MQNLTSFLCPSLSPPALSRSPTPGGVIDARVGKPRYGIRQEFSFEPDFLLPSRFLHILVPFSLAVVGVAMTIPTAGKKDLVGLSILGLM